MSDREPAHLGGDGPEPVDGPPTEPTATAPDVPEPIPDGEPTAGTALDTAPTRAPALIVDSAPIPAARAPALLVDSAPIPADGLVVDSAPVEAAPDDAAPAAVSEPVSAPAPRPAVEAPVRVPRREAPSVHVVGFWRRAAAAAIDLAIVVPSALFITLLVSRIGGIHLPPSNLRVFDVDMWIDLVLATDPALLMGLGLLCAIGMVYLLVFQIVVGRTVGMRVLRLKIIDVYGDRPSPARCVARCGGYLAGVATLFLGFLWIGFDSEKRGLQDWIAGTYVIRA